MLEGVIFDMDGLMFDTEPIWTNVWKAVFADAGAECPEGFLNSIRGTSGKSMEAVIHRFAPEVDAAGIRVGAYKMVHDMGLQGVPKKPGLDELVECLVAMNVPLAVASSSALESIESNLVYGGMRDHFSCLLSGVGMTHPKPAPDIFLAAAREIGAEPERTLVLEDSLSGVRAGVAGGFITVMVPDLVAPDEYAQANARHICSSLLEVRDLLVGGGVGLGTNNGRMSMRPFPS